ncbi:MAG: 5-formyltetrahydrofolate cyclo-ligase [Meiothermus sp.]|nr:5-formyltetrahydrofolate cyclo-ligase [Meiothermus sp.]
MDKRRLRGWAKQVRRGLNAEAVSVGLVRQLARFLRQRKPRHILLYSAFGSEPDLSGLLTLHEAQYYLPRVDGDGLHIHPLPCEMARHPFGFLEPAPNAPATEAARLEAVLVPGLAFDLEGYRVGYGKGFYDRFLAGLAPEVLTVGIVPDILFVERVPKDRWDVPVRYVATELGVTKTQ